MPVAFFTRTQTGALVSRLNNDVIGAQQAFTSTLSGVVSNVIALVLTAGVMFSLSWQITLLSIVMVPLFVLPAQRVGKRLQEITRESYELDASMNATMTERFNVAGALLVKLFGRPEAEAESVRRPGRPGPRHRRAARRCTARVFFTSLTLVAALATALVYGLGGWLAFTGSLSAGDVVALALLLTRLYGPLTALSNVRVDVMSALVSFDRVFEVLDLEPMIAEAPDAVPVPGRRPVDRVRRRLLPLPGAGRGVARLAGGRRRPRRSTRRRRAARRLLHAPSPASWSRWSARPAPASRRSAALVSRLYDVDRRRGAGRRRRRPGGHHRVAARHDRRGHPGLAPVPRHDRGPTCATPGPRPPRRSCGRRSTGAQIADLVRALPDGLDTVVGDRGLPVVRRREAADRDRPAAAQGAGRS